MLLFSKISSQFVTFLRQWRSHDGNHDREMHAPIFRCTLALVFIYECTNDFKYLPSSSWLCHLGKYIFVQSETIEKRLRMNCKYPFHFKEMDDLCYFRKRCFNSCYCFALEDVWSECTLSYSVHMAYKEMYLYEYLQSFYSCKAKSCCNELEC